MLEQATQSSAYPNQEISPFQYHAYRIDVTNPESGNVPSTTKCVMWIFIDFVKSLSA